MTDNKQGGLELLSENHESMENPWGKSVVGWKPTRSGLRGLFNPIGFACVWGIVTKLVDGVMRALYEQPLLVENPGSIVICQLGDRIGLVQNFRMTGPRILPDAGADYIKRLDEEDLWDELLKSLGENKWECPRGLAPCSIDKGESLADFVIRTAKLEALEEAGFTITNTKIVGMVNTNATFFPHAQYVVHAEIKSIGNANPDNLEIIGDKKLVTMAELREMNRRGEFDDGLTLAALALCGLALPVEE